VTDQQAIGAAVIERKEVIEELSKLRVRADRTVSDLGHAAALLQYGKTLGKPLEWDFTASSVTELASEIKCKQDRLTELTSLLEPFDLRSK
jgi:hypothetical protein